MKKIKVTNGQFTKLLSSLNENRTIISEGAAPDDLSILLNDNPSTYFIYFEGKGGFHIFRLLDFEGKKCIMNITKGGAYNSYAAEFNPKALVYGTDVILNYTLILKRDPNTGDFIKKEGSWKESISELTQIQLYDKSYKKLDSMEMDDENSSGVNGNPTSNTSSDSLDSAVDEFNDEFNNLKQGQKFKIEADSVFEGVVTSNTGDLITFKLTKNGKSIKCEFPFATSPHMAFEIEKDYIIFKPTRTGKGGKKIITIRPIHEFEVDGPPKSPEELEQEKRRKEKEDKEASERNMEKKKLDKDLGREVYDIIINNDNMRKAFFNQPTLLNLIKAGDPTGIVPAQEIIDKYRLSQSKVSEKMKKKFPINNTITFEVVENDIEIPDTDFVATVGKTYKGIIKGDDLAANYIQILHKKDKVDPEFLVELHSLESTKEDEADDIYPAIFKIEQLSSSNQGYGYKKSEMGKIQITNYKFR